MVKRFAQVEKNQDTLPDLSHPHPISPPPLVQLFLQVSQDRPSAWQKGSNLFSIRQKKRLEIIGSECLTPWNSIHLNLEHRPRYGKDFEVLSSCLLPNPCKLP